MTRVCVAGGTGQVGREVVRLALDAGLDVAVLSRRPPSGTSTDHDGARYFHADVTTGDGLLDALQGADVVIDCLEGRFGKARRKYPDGGARLLAAAASAGVGRAVLLSIINCDESEAAFYVSKADKERVYEASSRETVVVRATQFHSLVAGIFRAGEKLRLIPVFKGARFQTASPADVAAVLLEEALGEPSADQHRKRTIGGPEVLTMRQMAEIWLRTGHAGRIVEFPLPGAMGKYLRSGLNVIPEQRTGSDTFESWLAKSEKSL
ncbi:MULTISPECIES: SDR family oxidoreductase [Arthrobacter]|uniref:NAD-dependent epimerase/dehydratase family protein n=1 Tax=Arthrobacter terricola TaxID=2547396 RepID=A0A4R5L249_9MICC|nr:MULTISPECIES: NAD(P)H-binding protein [Arthrobacter]MBT8158943.1 NAD(P)H-binding protein [Arthrobacter sp. GN70]TDG01620.1 NAD-dependent epimerase/dehydratase family protein [Arthrobacter terricola]